MKLWIDDLRDAPDDSWTEVRKVEPAIRLLAHHLIEEISIDHDIENRPDDETFKPIAYFIGMKFLFRAAVRDPWTPKITIHSMNPVGAKEIYDILKSYTMEDITIAPPSEELQKFNAKYGL